MSKSVQLVSKGDGVVSGVYDPAVRVTQVFAVTEGEISGVKVSFPAGAFSIPTTISVQPGAGVANPALATELGIDTKKNMQPLGAAVVISSSENIDASRPFTLSIPVPAITSLKLLATQYYTVGYIVKNAAGEQIAGTLPSSKVKRVGDNLVFEAQYFGAYQGATVDEAITDAVSKTTTRRPITKLEVKGLAIEVADLRPIIAATDTEVTMQGKNFRQSMTIAFGSTNVRQLTVLSDVKATFKVPSMEWGPKELKISQDGVEEKGQFFALASKTDLPLITLDVDTVCTGITYYDIKGDKKTGTKACSSGASAYGGEIVAAATLSLGTSPSGLYKITGSPTTITALSAAPVGTEVTLHFAIQSLLQHSSVLRMPKEADFWVVSGDVVKLVSMDATGIWKVTSLSANHDAKFVGAITSPPTANCGSDSSSLDFTVTTDDQLSFNTGTKRFTAKKSGHYVGSWTSITNLGTFTAPSASSCEFRGYVNGSSTAPFIVSGSQSSSDCVASGSPPQVFFLKKGDYLEFVARGVSCGTFTPSTNATLSITMVSELQ